MKSLLVSVLTALCLMQSAAVATVIRVAQDGSGNYTTIQPAFDACQNGDTILIAAGTYGGGEVYFLQNRIDVIVSGAGSYGANVTFVQGTIEIRGCVASQIWSVKVHALDIHDCLDVEIRRCNVILYYNAISCNSAVAVDSSCRNLQFFDCAFQEGNPVLCLSGTGQLNGCVILTMANDIYFRPSQAGTWQVTNCVLMGNYALYPGGNNQVEMRNNILWVVYASAWPQVTWNYNACNLFLPGAGNILLSEFPLVYQTYDISTSDLHLKATSPCWDAGDPIIPDRYTRGHGTRSDIGCYGGMTPFFPAGLSPFPQPNVTLDLYTAPTVTVGDSLLIRSSAQIVPRY